MRERRAEVLRTQARRRLRAVVAVAALVVVIGGAWGLAHTRLLSARVVTVVGAVHTPDAAIIEAAGLTSHPPLIDVSGAAAAAVERLPWVKSATVARQWPDGVRITVVERSPVAAVASSASPPGGVWALVDGTGRVLADTTSVPPGLVRVVAPTAPGTPGSSSTGVAPALKVLTQLPAAFAAQVTEIDQSATGDLTLDLTSPVTVDLGSTVDLHQKFEDVAAALAGAPLSAGDVIDVAAPSAPVVAG